MRAESRVFLQERLAQGDSVLLIAEADGLAIGFTQLIAAVGWKRDEVFSVSTGTASPSPVITTPRLPSEALFPDEALHGAFDLHLLASLP